MKLKKFLYLSYAIFFLSILSNSKLISQTNFLLSEWKSYSSFSNAQCFCYGDSNSIWIGTTGGIFMVKDSVYTLYRNINALLDMNITAIYYDQGSKKIIAGTSSGILEVLYPDGSWHHFTDIKNTTSIANKTINQITSNSNKIFIAGGFGMTEFDLNSETFPQDVRRFGNFSSDANTSKILFQGKYIWVATEYGIARANKDSLIADRNQWVTYSGSDGLNQANIKDIVFINDTLFACSNNYIYKFDSNKFVVIYQTSTNETNINNLTLLDNNIVFSNQYSVNKIQSSIYSSYNLQINKAFVNPNNSNLIFGLSSTSGFFILDLANQNKITLLNPNAPITNNFEDITFDEVGNLWGTGGQMGISRYDGKNWYSYFTNNSEMKSGYTISSIGNNKIVVSSFGSGFYIIDYSNDNFVIDTCNSAKKPGIFEGFDGTPNFNIGGNVAVGRDGTLYFTNTGETGTGPLLVASKDNRFIRYENCVSNYNRRYFNLAIDSNGTVWVASSSYKPLQPESSPTNGLMFYNNNGTFDNIVDDFCEAITPSTATKLTSLTQTALAVDKNGILWVGTQFGVVYSPNTYEVLNKRTPSIKQIQIKPLQNQWVHDIMVDALNNKWFATENGIFVIDADAQNILATISTDNSPLTSNSIYSLTQNVNSGEVYIASKSGLFSVNTLSINPLSDYQIKCYPSPFNPSKDENLIIDGLAYQTNIRIITIDGLLIKNISTESRKIFWDGKDNKGNLVSNGVYLVVASSGSSTNASVSKIMVHNK